MAIEIVILVKQEGLGSIAPNDGQFGLEMFDRFIHSLEGQKVKPHAILFYTLGVKLACEGSHALFGLRMLEGMGVRVLVCKTCLEHYGLLDKLAVGEVSNMAEISRMLLDASKVISI